MSPLTIRVKPFRERAGLTQEQLADKARISRATLNRLERGHTKCIDLEVLEKLAGALGVDAALLIASK